MTNKDASCQWLGNGRQGGTLRFCGLGREGGWGGESPCLSLLRGEGWDIGAAGQKAMQPCENLGEWPLDTSLIGPVVAGKCLGVPSV